MAEAKKKTVKAAVKAEAVKLDHSKWYKFESNGKSSTMPKAGESFNVGGAVAETLVNNGLGKILD